MSELPFGLVIEILARVPVKDLLRFRCVCKSWRSLFQDKSFIRKHTTHSPRMYLYVCSPPDSPATCTYEGRRLEMVSQEHELNNGGENSLFLQTTVVGHYDGLFCLRLQDRSVAVWNPALRELRKLPTVKPERTNDMIGFGYDHSIQDHKIVLVPAMHKSREPLMNLKAQVWTLKSSVSRMVDFPWIKNWEWFSLKKEGTLVGENIFWQLYACDSVIDKSVNILSFSVVSETFSYCYGPDRIPGKDVYVVLHKFRGSLCAVESQAGYYSDNVVVWCAHHEKEDKRQIKSWSKILSLTKSDIERSICWQVSGFQVGTMINHAGLMIIRVKTFEREIKLCEYNFEKATMREVETSLPFSLGYCDTLVEYIATLVSPTNSLS